MLIIDSPLSTCPRLFLQTNLPLFPPPPPLLPPRPSLRLSWLLKSMPEMSKKSGYGIFLLLPAPEPRLKLIVGPLAALLPLSRCLWACRALLGLDTTLMGGSPVVEGADGVEAAVELSNSMPLSLSWLEGYDWLERKVNSVLGADVGVLALCCCCNCGAGGSDTTLLCSVASSLGSELAGTCIFLCTSGEELLVLVSSSSLSASASVSLVVACCCLWPLLSSSSRAVAHCRTLHPSPSIRPMSSLSKNASKSSKAS